MQTPDSEISVKQNYFFFDTARQKKREFSEASYYFSQ